MSTADQAEVKRLMDEINAAITDRRWDKVVGTCNSLSDVLFYRKKCKMTSPQARMRGTPSMRGYDAACSDTSHAGLRHTGFGARR